MVQKNRAGRLPSEFSVAWVSEGNFITESLCAILKIVQRIRRSSMLNGSPPYLRMLKNKIIPLDPSYLHELEVLRAMIRQEDYQESGWSGSWTKERYQDLKEKHPDALMVFETELRIEKERERHRRETFERLMPSAYIERKKRELPDSVEKDKYLRKLRNLKWLMIASDLGNMGYGGGIALGGLRNGYPEAYEAFKEELDLDRED